MNRSLYIMIRWKVDGELYMSIKKESGLHSNELVTNFNWYLASIVFAARYYKIHTRYRMLYQMVWLRSVKTVAASQGNDRGSEVIWIRWFHSEDWCTEQLFSVHTTAKGIQKCNNQQPCWICVFRKLGQRNYKIIMTPVSKSSVYKKSSLYSETKSRCFQIPPVSRVLSKSSVFGTD